MFWKILKGIWNRILALRDFKEIINKRMRGRYSAYKVVLLITILILIDGIIYLYLAKFSVGLDQDMQTILPLSSHGALLSLVLNINQILGLDEADRRVMATIYIILYIPGVYMLIYQACKQAKSFVETIIIGAVGWLIWGDVAYISYFNAFYVEGLWLVSLLYLVSIGMLFEEERSLIREIIYLLLFLVVAYIFVFVSRRGAISGFLIGAFCLKLFFVRKEYVWRLFCIIAVLYMNMTSLYALVNLEDDYSQLDHYHAMTQGILFTADNPQEALNELGIMETFEVLTENSLYDEIPTVDLQDTLLQEEFLNRYDNQDILIYYLRHPYSYLRLFNEGISSSYSVRESLVATSLGKDGIIYRIIRRLGAMWSSFKINSAPKTLGYLLILSIATYILYGRSRRVFSEEDQRKNVKLDMLLVVLGIIITQMTWIIVHSGTARFDQDTFLVGLCIDIMTYFVFSEILHRLNIL